MLYAHVVTKHGLLTRLKATGEVSLPWRLHDLRVGDHSP
jgi:hypothetical protein